MSDQAVEQTKNQDGPDIIKPKLRVGIIGCGEVTQIMHWPSLYQLPEMFEVIALCDISPLVLEELGRRWNIDSLTTDHRELVNRDKVDVVLIANPHAYHAEATLAAIAAGKHVLVEKPMCVTRREAEQIISAQKARNVVVQVGYMRRYAAAFLDACDEVRKMREIKFAKVRDFLGFNSLIIHPTSRVIRDEQLPDAIKKEAESRDEALVEEALGEKPGADLKRAYRLMLGLSSHDLSAMRELLGMPKRVLYAAQRSAGLYLGAAFDYGAYVCQFETGIDRIPRFDAYLEVFGDQKVIRVQYDTPYVRNLPIRLLVTENNSRGGVTQVDSHPAWGDPFVAEWKAFYTNVTEVLPPKSGPADFLQDLELFSEMARLMREP